MSTEVTVTQEQPTQTEAQTDIGALSFSDYEKVRRGEPLPESAKSATTDNPVDQKNPEESETSKTEEEEKESEDESESDEDAEKSEDSDKPKKKSGYQRRVDKLNSRIADERSKREELERRLAALERSGDSKEKVEPKVADADGKPNPDKFETHAEYVEALTDWKLDQRVKAAKDDAEKTKAQQEMDGLRSAYVKREKSFKEKTADYNDVLESVDDIVPPPVVAHVLLKSENGPALAYELAKNREELERICGLEPAEAVFALGKLEAKISVQASEAKKPEPPKLTKAPKPIEPVGGSKGSVTKSLDDPDLSFAEYERLRRKQLERKGA